MIGADLMLRHVIANRHDGLGGRLLTLMFSWALAAHFGARPLVHWPNTSDMSGHALDHLFAVAPDRPPPPGAARFDWLDLGRDDRFRRLLLIGPHDHLQPDHLLGCDTLVLRSANPQAIACFPDYGPQQLMDDSRRQMAAWPVAPAVLALVEKTERRIGAAQAVGVHVRRGDLIDHRNPVHRARLVPLDQYWPHLDALRDDERIFLATDDRGVVRAMRRRYGCRLIHSGAGGFSRRSRHDLQAAFAEILLLARCRRIVAGPSNFCRAASVIGGVPLTILPPSQVTEAWAREKGNWGVMA